MLIIKYKLTATLCRFVILYEIIDLILKMRISNVFILIRLTLINTKHYGFLSYESILKDFLENGYQFVT